MSRRPFIALLVLAILVAPCAGAFLQANPDQEARVAWLKKHAIALRSIDPADEDFADLEPLRKVIVWAASLHLMRNPATVRPLQSLPADYYRDLVTMGHKVWKALGQESYTLAFVAAEGEAGWPGQKPSKLDPVQPGSLEALLLAAGHTNCIVDFRQLDESGSWLRSKLIARPLGNSDMTADWSNVFDGVVFTRTMFPSTLAKRANPQTRPVPPVYLGIEADLDYKGKGVKIAGVVKGSPAEKAGIMANDIITAFDSMPVNSGPELGAAILKHKPGDEVLVEVRRGEKTLQLKVTLDKGGK